jgi:hypothetical protein
LMFRIAELGRHLDDFPAVGLRHLLGLHTHGLTHLWVPICRNI